eukprot:scaffold18263_cov29-Tisochrysis_lutea.AAC.3
MARKKHSVTKWYSALTLPPFAPRLCPSSSVTPSGTALPRSERSPAEPSEAKSDRRIACASSSASSLPSAKSSTLLLLSPPSTAPESSAPPTRSPPSLPMEAMSERSFGSDGAGGYMRVPLARPAASRAASRSNHVLSRRAKPS